MAIPTARLSCGDGRGERPSGDTALGLAAKSYRVFGTAMKEEELADLEQASGGAVRLSRCDITDEHRRASVPAPSWPARTCPNVVCGVPVHRWARDVATQTDGGLDLLISNAGILTEGPVARRQSTRIRSECVRCHSLDESVRYPTTG